VKREESKRQINGDGGELRLKREKREYSSSSTL